MKDRPIIFSTPMVRAILDGRKTQTRRVVKPQPKPHQSGGWIWEKVGGIIATKSGKIYKSKMLSRNPYGKPGDRLWVRETWANVLCHKMFYKADGNDLPKGCVWKPSIHMFKMYARIWLEITGIRVERLKDLSPKDGIAEGVEHWSIFPSLWDSINGKKHPWKSNPWVWIIEFKRLNPNDARA